MAEFCEKCFVRCLLSDKEKKDYEKGYIRLKLSKDADLCEGCGELKPVVVEIEK